MGHLQWGWNLTRDIQILFANLIRLTELAIPSHRRHQNPSQILDDTVLILQTDCWSHRQSGRDYYCHPTKSIRCHSVLVNSFQTVFVKEKTVPIRSLRNGGFFICINSGILPLHVRWFPCGTRLIHSTLRQRIWDIPRNDWIPENCGSLQLHASGPWFPISST